MKAFDYLAYGTASRVNYLCRIYVKRTRIRNLLSFFDNLCIYPALGDPEPDPEVLDDPSH